PVEIEAIGFEGQTVEAVASEHLEHRERVVQACAVHAIEEAGEEQMSQVHDVAHYHLIGEMPHFPALSVHSVPGPQHERGPSGGQWLEQALVVVEVVFEIGVLNQDEVSRRVRQAASHGVALATRAILIDDPHSWPPLEL